MPRLWRFTRRSKPNIVILWGDDIGQSNISAYSHGVMGYKTPNIDRLAREGMMFTDYYAEQSCTAGRASFITGQSGLRTGMTKVGIPGSSLGLRKEDPTIAELIKPLGYATGQFGKNLTTHDYPTHLHEALLVATTEAGGSEIEAAGVPDEAHGEALLVVNPAEPHASRMRRSRGWRYRSFYLMESAMAEVCASIGVARFPAIEQGMIRSPDLAGRFIRLHRALEAGSDPLLGRELLVGAFGELVSRHGAASRPVPPPPRDRALLARLVATMRERHAERLTLDELAAPVGLTSFQLIGLFRRGVGLTPHAYLTQVRLGVACHHLRRGMPIAAAAAASGFYDQSALTNHFKRSYGMTPRQYVRAVRNFRQYRAGGGAAGWLERCDPSTTDSPTPWS